MPACFSEIFFGAFPDAKKHLENIINIEPGNLMNIGLCGYQKNQERGLHIVFCCVILSAMKEVPVRHPARKFWAWIVQHFFFISIKHLKEPKGKNNANCIYETEIDN